MQMSLTGKVTFYSDPVMYKIMNQCCEMSGVENYKYQKILMRSCVINHNV